MDDLSFITDDSNHTVLSTSLHSLSDGVLPSELESLGGVEGTVFEINDFTTVTPWEVFVSSLDATLQEWSKMNVTQNTSITGTFLSTTVSYAEVRFSLSFYMHGDHQGHTVIPLCSYPHEMMSEDPSGDFPLRAHPVTRWYGIKNFALLSPYDPKHQQTWTLSQTRFLFSSLLPAMDSSHYQLPIFFRAQEADRHMYVGVGHYDHRRTWFEMVHIRHVPPNLQYLSGLVELLKGKLSPTASLPSIKIQVSIKNTYRADCGSLVRFFPCSHPSPSQWDRLPYGSKTSPISSLTLSVCWPTQDESLVRDNQSFSDLNPLEASRWLLSCSAAPDNECYLSCCLESFASLFTHTDSISSLLDQLVPGSYLQTSEEQTRFRNALKHVTGRTEPRPRSLRDVDTPLKLSTLQSMMNYLFKPAPRKPQAPHFSYKTAPPDSLTERVCLCASAVMFSHGGLPGLLQLWHDVISELRRAWETGEELPDIDGEMPDFQYGLLHQKLQMLQCCIRHKNSLSPLSPTNPLLSLPPACPLGPHAEVRYDRAEGQVVISSPSASDSDEFFEARDVLTSQETDCSESEEANGSVFQSLPSPEPSGRLKPAGMVLMLTGEDMHVPVTQEHAPLTEDTLREQTHILSQLGSSEEASILRASMQSLTLRSDMSAFKAANPGCVLEDFIRWYSPRDFIPMERGFSSMDMQSPLQNSPVPSLSFMSAVSSLETLSPPPQDLTPVVDELGDISLDVPPTFLLKNPSPLIGQSVPLEIMSSPETAVTPVSENPPPTAITPVSENPPPTAITPVSENPPPTAITPVSENPPPTAITPVSENPPPTAITPVSENPPPTAVTPVSEDPPPTAITPVSENPPPTAVTPMAERTPAAQESAEVHVRGRLSTRIRGSNSTWIQAWTDSVPVPAKRQKRLFDDTKEAEKVLQFLSTLSPCQLSCFIFPSLLQSALVHFSSLPVACEARCSELLGQLQSKLSELESLGGDYLDFSMKFCRETLSLLTRIDSHFCSLQATYHYLMHGYHVLNDVEVHLHFEAVDKEILGLAARLQRASADVIELEGGAGSVQGQAVMGVFKSVLSSHSPFKRKKEGGGLHSTQPMFGKAVFREYVLRTICPNPQAYSTTCHHRLYACLSQEETRIATAVSEDLRLF